MLCVCVCVQSAYAARFVRSTALRARWCRTFCAPGAAAFARLRNRPVRYERRPESAFVCNAALTCSLSAQLEAKGDKPAGICMDKVRQRCAGFVFGWLTARVTVNATTAFACSTMKQTRNTLSFIFVVVHDSTAGVSSDVDVSTRPGTLALSRSRCQWGTGSFSGCSSGTR
jgi:hypothetical protein